MQALSARKGAGRDLKKTLKKVKLMLDIFRIVC